VSEARASTVVDWWKHGRRLEAALLPDLVSGGGVSVWPTDAAVCEHRSELVDLELLQPGIFNARPHVTDDRNTANVGVAVGYGP